LAIGNSVDDKILDKIEKEVGWTIKGENPKDILTEVSRLLTDEIGTMKSGNVILT